MGLLLGVFWVEGVRVRWVLRALRVSCFRALFFVVLFRGGGFGFSGFWVFGFWGCFFVLFFFGWGGVGFSGFQVFFGFRL